jgi:phosphatidylglycerophosphate synthase
MAHLISLARLGSAVPFGWLVLHGDARAAPLFALAVVSDLVDGPLARRAGAASALGRLLDHGADFAFVSAGLWAAACRGSVPLLLPAAIAVAFAQYALDSGPAGARALRASRLGRWNGVLYFVPLGGVCLLDLGAAALEPAIRGLSWVLVATSALSIADRLRGARAFRRRAR